MAFDPNQATPSGRTYAQIDADQARYVREANDALNALRGQGGRWWFYSVSHCTFEVVIGEPYADDNMVIALSVCQRIGGPVQWADQQLRVVWHNGRAAGAGWEFALVDHSVGFEAVGGWFRWQRGYNLLKHHSLCMPRSR